MTRSLAAPALPPATAGAHVAPAAVGTARAIPRIIMTNSIKKMSDAVIECELRAAWGEVETSLRHGQEPSARVSNYVAALTAEQQRRAA